MAAAAAAMDLGPGREQCVILFRAHRALDRLEEARPAGAAVIFGLRAVDGQRAAGADEGAAAMLLVERRRAGPLGAGLPENAILLRAEDGAPLLRRFNDLERLGGLGSTVLAARTAGDEQAAERRGSGSNES